MISVTTRLSILVNATVFVVSLVGGSSSAQEFAPPTMCPEVGECVAPGTGPVGDVPYDLGALPDIVRDVEWPRPPAITRNVTVRTNAEFQSALGANGARVTVASGTYNGGIITCSDCEFVLANGATIQGRLAFRGSRIRWSGGTVQGGPVDLIGRGDVLIDNLYSVTQASLNNFTGSVDGWNRVAIINSTLEVANGQVTGTWGMYVQPLQAAGQFRGRDFILANVRIESTGQNNRFQNINNLVIVDSYFNGNNTSFNGLRMNHRNRDVFMRDTTIVGINISAGSDNQITNGRFENVTHYDNYNTFYSVGIGERTVNVTINNSQSYTTATGFIGRNSNLGGATGTNPPVASWDGTTLPDASTVGARR